MIKSQPLRVALASQDFFVLLASDGPLGSELYLRPLPTRNQPGQQPVHIKGEIMQTPQKDACGNSACRQNMPKMLGPSFHQFEIADMIEWFLSDAPDPAIPS